MLSLVGLVGAGSIPTNVAVAGGLLSLFVLWVLAYAIDLSTANGKETNMKAIRKTTDKDTAASRSLANTIWAIGTSTLSGLALLG